jgi:hypothetical protein
MEKGSPELILEKALIVHDRALHCDCKMFRDVTQLLHEIAQGTNLTVLGQECDMTRHSNSIMKIHILNGEI